MFFAGLIRNDCTELYLEYHELGDLWGYMNQRGMPLAVNDCASVLQQMLVVLMYHVDLHGTHRDIKPENLLLVNISPINVKLIDFGLACYHRDSGFDISLGYTVGTVPYAAPEMWSAFMGKAPAQATDLASPKLDVWALDATTWFCAAREYVREPEPGKAVGVTADEEAELPAVGKAETLERSDDVENAPTIILPHAKPANIIIRAPGSKVVQKAKLTSEETSLIPLAERHRAFPASRQVPDGLVALLDSMLAADPANRPSAQQRTEDQWLLKPFETDTQ
ncbi:hypothetical protein KVT40_001657 [Elsinoe batatas]|uniref:Protein kinase domain-containing protein n=1 Tax=Elsinoe batatas TaxID=2601811 RepID=A0A8K0LD52_9PEZI|nr:hypothetical protein KVT40_001657 [Elsinoe batatas]